MVESQVLVEFRQVTKKYGDLVVLNSLDTEFYQGETHVLCGRSGAGKSTLIRTINYLEPIDNGTIYFEGLEVNHKNARKVRKQVGMVFQEFNLFPHLTVQENVTLGPKKALGVTSSKADEKAKHILERVGLGEKANTVPLELSGGQRQRVAIARTLAMEPDLILFDEPTTSLDPELVDDVLNVMEDLAKEGRSMIVVTHQMGFAREAADKISFMDNGKLIETQPPEKMLENPKCDSTARFLSNVLSV